jgi:hypothetical protein
VGGGGGGGMAGQGRGWQQAVEPGTFASQGAQPAASAAGAGPSCGPPQLQAAAAPAAAAARGPGCKQGPTSEPLVLGLEVRQLLGVPLAVRRQGAGGAQRARPRAAQLDAARLQRGEWRGWGWGDGGAAPWVGPLRSQARRQSPGFCSLRGRQGRLGGAAAVGGGAAAAPGGGAGGRCCAGASPAAGPALRPRGAQAAGRALQQHAGLAVRWSGGAGGAGGAGRAGGGVGERAAWRQRQRRRPLPLTSAGRPGRFGGPAGGPGRAARLAVAVALVCFAGVQVAAVCDVIASGRCDGQGAPKRCRRGLLRSPPRAQVQEHQHQHQEQLGRPRPAQHSPTGLNADI